MDADRKSSTENHDVEDLPDTAEIVEEMGRDSEEELHQLPSPAVANPPLPPHLDALADRARDYVEAASSVNTRRAYASDWRHFASWCRRQGIELFPSDPQVVGLYITACASGTATGDKKPNSVATIERRLSALAWNYAQRGQPLDRKDRHIATVMAGIPRSISPMPPNLYVVGSILPIAPPAASPASGNRTVEQRLAALIWIYAQHGRPVGRNDRLARLMASIRNAHTTPPEEGNAPA